MAATRTAAQSIAFMRASISGGQQMSNAFAGTAGKGWGHRDPLVTIKVLTVRSPQRLRPPPPPPKRYTRQSDVETVHRLVEDEFFDREPFPTAEEQRRIESRQREQLQREVQRVAAQGRALIELAWRPVVWQPDCKLVKKWRHVFGNPKATKAARKKAIVAMARQMAVDLWRWRTGRVTAEALGWKMVGEQVAAPPELPELNRCHKRPTETIGNGARPQPHWGWRRPALEMGRTRFLAVTARVKRCRPSQRTVIT
jgi:hypothetical protein